MKAISEAGVWYLEPQGEPHYGVAKNLSVNPPTPSISWQYLNIRFYLSVKMGSNAISSLLGEPKVLPNHTDVGSNPPVSLGPRFQPYGNVWYVRIVESRRCLPLTVLNLYGLHSGWFEVWSWSWTNILNQVIGCPILGSTFVWSSRSFFSQ